MIHFKRLGDRLLVSVGSVVIIGLIVLGIFYAFQLDNSIQAENELALAKVTNSVAEGLTALMAGGHSKAAQEFAARLKNVPNILDYRIIRTDGSEAFVDNSTVDKVNDKLGEFEFTGRKGNPPPVRVIPSSHPVLVKALQTGGQVFDYRTLPGGERIVMTMGPIKAQPLCKKCHLEGEKVRGFVMLTSSLKQVDEDIAHTNRMSFILIGLGLVLLIGMIYFVAQRTVIRQITGISEAMEIASGGRLDTRVKVHSEDELGLMAQSFNQMNEDLARIYANLEEEKNKLNAIIQGANSGVVVTDDEMNIVLVNKAAREMLGKEEQTIIQEGFLGIFDNRAWMQERLSLSQQKSPPGLLNWSGHVLSVQASTIRDSMNKVIGSAALIRDVTEEKRLEEELKKQSITDALTGLYNRRHFDEVINAEFKRWARYVQPCSVIMLDVDHFKKFNDTHGHECGDRVLQAIGRLLKARANATFVPCRYGGEEMVAILPGTEQAAAIQSAEEIRSSIAELVIDGLKVTVSIGVASVPGHFPQDADALVKLADNALYDAKQGGRNQVRAAFTPKSA